MMRVPIGWTGGFERIRSVLSFYFICSFRLLNGKALSRHAVNEWIPLAHRTIRSIFTNALKEAKMGD